MQSAVLYSQYYQLQIMVHRPFIPTAQKPSKLSFPSLAICTNAARAISHITDAARKHYPGRAFPDLQMPSFTAAIVLLLHIWGHRRAGQTASGMDYTQEMQSVEKCMHVLKDTEKRWHTAGRLWDVLYELASVGDLPLPQTTPTAKRDRDSDSPRSTQSSSAGASPPAERATAGNRRARAAHTVSTSHSRAQQHVVSPQQQQQSSSFMFEPLPMNTDELGRMAVPGSWAEPAFPTAAPAQFNQNLGTMPNAGPLPSGDMSVGGDPSAQGMSVGGSTAPAPLNMFDALLAGMPTGMGTDVAMDTMGAGMHGMGLDMWSNMPTGYG